MPECAAAGCMSTDVTQVTYVDTFDDDEPASDWLCPKHADFFRQRDLAALGLHYIKSWQAAQEALAALETDRTLITTPDSDPHLIALDTFVQAHRKLAALLDTTNDPRLKALLAEADDGLIARIDGMLTLALTSRRHRPA
jgi:hypothetical protein